MWAVQQYPIYGNYRKQIEYNITTLIKNQRNLNIPINSNSFSVENCQQIGRLIRW